MPTRYMLDTNTASFVIKGQKAVRERLLKVSASQVCISVITEAELLFGVARKPQACNLKTAVDEFLLLVDVLAWNSDAARRYALMRVELEQAGTPLGNLDLLIASHARAVDAVLVSNDQSFKTVPQLQLTDWTK